MNKPELNDLPFKAFVPSSRELGDMSRRKGAKALSGIPFYGMLYVAGTGIL